MYKKYIFIYSFIGFWFIFAIIFEKKDQKNAYLGTKSQETDNIHKSLSKLKYLISYDNRTIKWRRAIIFSVILISLLFLLCWYRFPTPKELIIHTLLCIGVYSYIWNNYTETTGKDVISYFDGISKHIKKIYYFKKNV